MMPENKYYVYDSVYDSDVFFLVCVVQKMIKSVAVRMCISAIIIVIVCLFYVFLFFTHYFLFLSLLIVYLFLYPV